MEKAINIPIVDELNKTEYKKFVDFLDQAIEMKRTGDGYRAGDTT